MKKNNKRKSIGVIRGINKPLLILSLIFIFGGAFMILSASSISSVLQYEQDTYYFCRLQLEYIAAALAASLVVINIPTSFYSRLGKYLIYVVLGITLIIFVKESLFNKNVSDVAFDALGRRVQIAEFLKLMLIVYLGIYYGNYVNQNKTSWAKTLTGLGLSILAGLFIALGGDFGTGAIMLTLFALMFIMIPIRTKPFGVTKMILIAGMIVCISGLLFAYKVVPESKLLSDPRTSRLVYKNPCDRSEDVTGYQVCNGFIALDNGGLHGLGIGNSVQKYMYLPASHTDFIFAIVIEELGSLVGVGIIIGYLIMIYMIVVEAINSYNLQNSLICFGIAMYIMLHVIVNLGGVFGLLPVTGIPLPFLSYGGSCIISMIIGLALVQRIHIENVNEKKNRLISKEE